MNFRIILVYPPPPNVDFITLDLDNNYAFYILYKSIKI